MVVNFIKFQNFGDDRGSLIVMEDSKEIPFTVKRLYYIYGTKNKKRRGFHAHKKLKQIAIALCGSCHFMLDDGREKVDILLNNPERGLYIESFVWREMYNFSDDCVLLVIADSTYDEDDYIRDYKEFKKMVNHDT